MLVVSDASPINILVRIGHITVLPKLFQSVVIPPAVSQELSHVRTPKDVRDWLATRPAWLHVRAPSRVDPTLTRDPGEREAICLAREIRADAILLDDLRARQIAGKFGLNVTGTVGVLALAADRGWLVLRDALAALARTDFRLSEELVRKVLQDDPRRAHQE
jgi:predicted nucleic acid-binding protein